MSEEHRGEGQPKAPKQPWSTRKKALVIALGVLLALLLAAAVAALVLYQNIAGQLDGETTHDGTLSAEVKTEDVYPSYTGDAIINILVCGLDYPEEGELPEGVEPEDDWQQDTSQLVGGGAKTVGNTDMILYLQYNTETGEVPILQIPRDVFVGEALATGGTGKINGLYINAPDAENRVDALAKAVRYQLGLPVDYYITIDMDAVKDLIDQPPGYIPVYVPMEVNDPQDPDAVIPEGWRDFTSSEAEWFLRNRKSTTYNDQGDIMRLQMQQSFYSALYRRFKELTPSDLLMWMRVLLYRVNTDMPPLEIGGLAQKALGVQGSDITFVRPPVTGADYVNEAGEHYSLLCLEPEETAELLNEYFRPEGESMSADELDIHTLPMNHIGKSETYIRTMSDLQANETDPAIAAEESSVSAD